MCLLAWNRIRREWNEKLKKFCGERRMYERIVNEHEGAYIFMMKVGGKMVKNYAYMWRNLLSLKQLYLIVTDINLARGRFD